MHKSRRSGSLTHPRSRGRKRSASPISRLRSRRCRSRETVRVRHEERGRARNRVHDRKNQRTRIYRARATATHRKIIHRDRTDSSIGDLGSTPTSHKVHHAHSEEHDPMATRTLLVSNLESKTTEKRLKRIFRTYGKIKEVQVDLNQSESHSTATAFITFADLDMSERAKRELSGKYIGKLRCNISYVEQKQSENTRIWVGGLGKWTRYPMLRFQFDHFGLINKVDWKRGDDHAYITFDELDGAKAAAGAMKGYDLVGPWKRIRTDFAKDEIGNEVIGVPDNNLNPNLVSSIGNPVWNGTVVLKQSLIPIKLFLVDGALRNPSILTQNEHAHLKIDGCFFLVQDKLESFTQYLNDESKNFGMFLVVPGKSVNDLKYELLGFKYDTLQSLESYLEDKGAGAVIPLEDRHKNLIGSIYLFPKCEYILELLKKKNTYINENIKEEYMVAVLFHI